MMTILPTYMYVTNKHIFKRKEIIFTRLLNSEIITLDKKWTKLQNIKYRCNMYKINTLYIALQCQYVFSKRFLKSHFIIPY